MARSTPPSRRHALTGSRIRERRLALGMKQGDLAERVGVSASYLNLIEHNKRRIGGKLLLDLARAMEVEPARLSDGMDASLSDMVHAAAGAGLPALGPPAELDRIEEFAGRFPGWIGIIAAQQKRIADLEAAVEGLRDRLAHDPVLAGAMHEMLSTVAAIRSTSDILVREPDLEAVWRGRFHRNLHEEAERLSDNATALLRHFERQGARTDLVSTPQERVEAAFDAAGHHFPAIEAGGVVSVAEVIEGMEGLDDVALVLRRLASLPEGGAEGVPGFGLAICDAAGALIFRRRIPAFSVPRYGAGCALWPLYGALARPMVPDLAVLEQPDGARFRAWAVAAPVGATGFGAQPVMQAVMLLRAVPEDEALAQGPRPVGPGCEMCPREECAARRG